MKPAGILVTNVLVVVAAIAVYHVLFHGDAEDPGSNGQELQGGGVAEREQIESELLRADGAFSADYDEAAMQRIVAIADIELTPEQASEILPRLHAHLVKLRKNLEEARAAAVAGKPDAQRVIYRARAAQLHGAFQAYLRKHVSPQVATALFKAAPAMMPPVPGSTAPGRTNPTPDGRAPAKTVIKTDPEK